MSSKSPTSTTSTSSPTASPSHSIEEPTLELHSCGYILMALESSLLNGDMLSFNSLLEDVIPAASSPAPAPLLPESKTIDISTISVSDLKDCGLFFFSLTHPPLTFLSLISFLISLLETIGKMDPYVELNYCQADDPRWSYQTIVHEDDGQDSDWIVNQTFHLQLSANNHKSQSNEVLKVKVKDKNDIKSDTLIGSGSVSCSQLSCPHWDLITVKLHDKKDKHTGNVTIKYKFTHFIPPPPIPPRPQQLHAQIHTFQPAASSDTIPLIVLQFDSLPQSLNQFNDLSEQFHVHCQEWHEEHSHKESPRSNSTSSPTSTTTKENSQNFFLFCKFPETIQNENYLTLQNNYKMVFNLLNQCFDE